MKRLAVVLLALAVLVPAATAQGRLKVVADCLDTAYKPKQIVLACGDGGALLSKLDWARWGGAKAKGSATLVVNTCKPSCVKGNFKRTPDTQVTLKRRRTCHGDRVYTRVSFKTPGDKRRRVRLFCP